MAQVRDPLIDRHAAPQSKQQDSDDQTPEVQLLAPAERMKLVGGLCAAMDAKQQEQFIACIHDRVDRFGEHGRAARDDARRELGNPPHHVGCSGAVHGDRTFRRHGPSPALIGC